MDAQQQEDLQGWCLGHTPEGLPTVFPCVVTQHPSGKYHLRTLSGNDPAWDLHIGQNFFTHHYSALVHLRNELEYLRTETQEQLAALDALVERTCQQICREHAEWRNKQALCREAQVTLLEDEV